MHKNHLLFEALAIVIGKMRWEQQIMQLFVELKANDNRV